MEVSTSSLFEWCFFQVNRDCKILNYILCYTITNSIYFLQSVNGEDGDGEKKKKKKKKKKEDD